MAALVISCGKKEASRPAEVMSVKSEVVRMSTDYDVPTYVGQVEEQTSTAVSFTGMGVLEQVLVGEGDMVNKGQVLAVMNAESAKSALMAAEAQYNQAKDALARLKQVHDSGSLPDVKWVEVQSQVQQAESQVRVMQKQVADCKLVSPVSGVVGKGVMKAGETALPAQPVVQILDISSVKVRVAVPEKELGRIAAHQPTTVTVAALPGEVFHSASIKKSVQGDVLTHTYDMYVNVGNPNRKLLPGMVANVSFDVAKAEAALTVPVRCVQKGADGNFVWTIKDGKAHKQTVKLGASYANRIVIIEGLSEGAVVITEGYQKVSEGSQVRG